MMFTLFLYNQFNMTQYMSDVEQLNDFILKHCLANV